MKKYLVKNVSRQVVTRVGVIFPPLQVTPVLLSSDKKLLEIKSCVHLRIVDEDQSVNDPHVDDQQHDDIEAGQEQEVNAESVEVHVEFQDMTLEELKAEAKKRDITGVSRTNRDDLIEILINHDESK